MVVSKLFSKNKKNIWTKVFNRARLEGSFLFLLVIVISIIASFVWAQNAQIDKVVRVDGKIIPAGHSRQIQHLEGGIISEINTYEGAVVKKGDLLLTIEDANAQAGLNEIKVKLKSLSRKIARLRAEENGKNNLKISKKLGDKYSIAAEHNLFLSRKHNIMGSLTVQEELIKQHKASLNENKIRLHRLYQELSVASKRSRMFEAMAKKNAASQIEVLNAQSRENKIKTEISNVITASPKLEASIREVQANISRIKSSYKSDIQKQLVEALSKVNLLKESMNAAKDRKKRTEIRSPMDGVINRIRNNTIGSVVKAGQNIIELTPKTKKILIEAKARPQDRGEIHSGINAIIRVSAYDVGSFGTLKGHVTEISADTVYDSKGRSYYRVKILINDIPNSYIGKSLMPGMTVTSDLVTGRRTVLSYLTSPLRKFTNNMFRDSR